MKLKLRLLTLAISTTLLLCACGKSKESINSSDVSINNSTTKTDASTTNSSPQALQTTQSAVESTTNTQMGSFDWDTAMSELYLRGTKVSVPFSLKSLGNTFDGFEILEPRYNSFGDKVSVFASYDQGIVCYATYYNVNLDNWNEDMVVDCIDSIPDFNVQGIKKGTTEKEVLEIWGEPDKVGGNLYHEMLYIGDESRYLYLLLDPETMLVKTIVIFFDSSESKLENLEKTLELMEDE